MPDLSYIQAVLRFSDKCSESHFAELFGVNRLSRRRRVFFFRNVYKDAVADAEPPRFYFRYQLRTHFSQWPCGTDQLKHEAPEGDVLESTLT